MSSSLWSCRLCSPWNSPGQNTGVGSRSLPNPGIKPRSPALLLLMLSRFSRVLLHCRWTLLSAELPGKLCFYQWDPKVKSGGVRLAKNNLWIQTITEKRMTGAGEQWGGDYHQHSKVKGWNHSSIWFSKRISKSTAHLKHVSEDLLPLSHT